MQSWNIISSWAWKTSICWRCWWFMCFNRYTINDRNLGRLPYWITTTYNEELQLWQVRTCPYVFLVFWKVREKIPLYALTASEFIPLEVCLCFRFSFFWVIFLTLALQMENFFKLTPDAGAGEMPRQQALETVKNNIEWTNRNQAEIAAWLESNVPEKWEF